MLCGSENCVAAEKAPVAAPKAAAPAKKAAPASAAKAKATAAGVKKAQTAKKAVVQGTRGTQKAKIRTSIRFHKFAF